MCKWNKHGDTRIDPCMRIIVRNLNHLGIITVMCCCGHGKYEPSLLVRLPKTKLILDLFSGITWMYKTKRFYKRDENGFYFIPEVVNESRV